MKEFVALEFPPWITWGQRSGGKIDRDGWPRGENGRPLCGWCKTECPPHRSSWCSDQCWNNFTQIWSWSAVSAYVQKRDKQTCQLCGTIEPPKPKNRDRYSPWDVDHIVRVIDGGTDDPANLRLLCIPCHIVVTNEARPPKKGSVPHPDQHSMFW